MKRSPRTAAGKPVRSGARGISCGTARGRTLRSTYHAWQAPLKRRVLAIEVDPVCSAPVDAHGGPPLGAPSRHGYLPARSHVAVIGVAGSHENSARMTRAIYNALANRGYLLTRRTHHYSHTVEADASCASRHSRRRIRSWLCVTSLLSQRKRCWPRLPSACIRDGTGLSARTIAQCLCDIFLHVLMHLHFR